MSEIRIYAAFVGIFFISDLLLSEILARRVNSAAATRRGKYQNQSGHQINRNLADFKILTSFDKAAQWRNEDVSANTISCGEFGCSFCPK